MGGWFCSLLQGRSQLNARPADRDALAQRLRDGQLRQATIRQYLIGGWPVVEQFFSRLNELLSEQATLCIYGPFNYNDNFTSASNQAFDASLKHRDPAMGIRDISAVVTLAIAAGFTLLQDHSMPANNRLLQFERCAISP